MDPHNQFEERHLDFEAFGAIVRSIRTGRLNNDGMKFLNDAAKFYDISTERFKAELRLNQAFTDKQSLQKKQLRRTDNVLNAGNQKAVAIADAVRNKIESITGSVKQTTVESLNGEDKSETKETGPLKNGEFDLPKSDTNSTEVKMEEKLTTAVKILESKALKEKRNYLTLASGVTVSLKRTSNLLSKIDSQMPRPVLVNQQSVKLKRGLLNEVMPPASTSNDSTVMFNYNMKSGRSDGTETNLPGLSPNTATAKASNEENRKLPMEFAATDQPIKAKRSKMVSIKGTGKSHISAETLTKSLDSMSNISFVAPISAGSQPVLVRNVSMSSKNVPVTSVVGVSPVAQKVSAARSSVSVMPNNVVRATAPGVYLAAYNKFVKQDEDDEDSEPEFDTSRFGSSTSSLSSSMNSVDSTKSVTSVQQLSQSKQPVVTFAVTCSSMSSQPTTVGVRLNDPHGFFPRYNPQVGGTKDKQLPPPQPMQSNFDLTSPLTSSPSLQYFSRGSPMGSQMSSVSGGSPQLQEVAGRQLVLSKSHNRNNIGSAPPLYIHSSTGTVGQSSSPRSGHQHYQMHRSPVIGQSNHPIAVQQQQHLHHTLYSTETNASISSDQPTNPNQIKVVQKSLNKSSGGSFSVGTVTLNRQSVSQSPVVDSTVSQGHSLPFSSGIHVNKVDRSGTTVGDRSATVSILPLQRKSGSLANVPKAIIQPNSNSGQPLLRNLDSRQAVLPKAFVQPTISHSSLDHNLYNSSSHGDSVHLGNSLSSSPMTMVRPRTIMAAKPSVAISSIHSSNASNHPRSNSSSSLEGYHQHQSPPTLTTINPLALQQLGSNCSPAVSLSNPGSRPFSPADASSRITLVNVASSSPIVATSYAVTAASKDSNRFVVSNSTSRNHTGSQSNLSSPSNAAVNSAYNNPASTCHVTPTPNHPLQKPQDS